MLCKKCGNEHPGHDCNKFADHLKLDDAGVAYMVGVTHGSTICEALWQPCDKTCVWPPACKCHIECQCVDQYGNEFYSLLTMDNASYLVWKTKMRIYQIGEEEVKRVNRVESRKPQDKWQPDSSSHGRNMSSCPQCGAPLAHEGGCMACYSCGWSACG